MREIGDVAPAIDSVPVTVRLAVLVVPVSVGDAESTTEPDPVLVVVPVPPLMTGNVPTIEETETAEADVECHCVPDEALNSSWVLTGIAIEAFVANPSIAAPEAGYTLMLFVPRLTTITVRPAAAVGSVTPDGDAAVVVTMFRSDVNAP